MPVIVPIVEGDGDVQAVPVLLSRLINDKQYWGGELRHQNAQVDYQVYA